MTYAPDEPASLGELLRRHRVEAGVTQEELAELAQVSVRSISDLERGLQRSPHRDTVRRLGQALGLEPEEQAAFEGARRPRPLSLIAGSDAASADDPAGRAVSTRESGVIALADRRVTGRLLTQRLASWHRRTYQVRFRRSILGPVSVSLALAMIAGSVAWVRATSSSYTVAPAFGRFIATLPLLATLGPVLEKPTGLAISRHGEMYVLDGGADRVWRFAPNGALLGFWGSVGSAPGQFLNPANLAADTHGDVYVCDTGNNRIEKFTASGKLLAVWGGSTAESGRFSTPKGVTVGNDGLIYVADSGHARVQVLYPSGRTRTNSPYFYGPGGHALPYPVAVTADTSGDLFVADTGQNLITEYPSTGVLTAAQWSGTGDPTSLALDGKGHVFVTDPRAGRVAEYTTSGHLLTVWNARTPLARFQAPTAIAAGPHGAMYIVGSGHSRIMRLTLGSWSPVALGGSVTLRGNAPQAIAVDARGTLYAVDQDRILERPASGAWRLLWHAQPRAGVPYIGPIGGIAVDREGHVYTTDYGSGNLLRLSATDERVRLVGQNATASASWHPEGVMVNGRGEIYVVGQETAVLLEFNPAGQFVRSVHIDASPAASGLGPYPHGVAVDSRGFIYVTDELNDRVLKLSSTGSLVAAWGSSGSALGQFRTPQGVAVDNRTGALYIADTGNNRVVILSEEGRVLGSRSFARPTDVVTDPRTGTLWVSESARRRVDVFAPG